MILLNRLLENLSLVRIRNNLDQSWKRYSVNHHTEDLTQKAGRSDDFTQQPSGKLKCRPGIHNPINLGIYTIQFNN